MQHNETEEIQGSTGALFIEYVDGVIVNIYKQTQE